MKCPKCGENIGFFARDQSLWTDMKESRVGFGNRRKGFQSVEFTCNSIDCGYKLKAWVKLHVKNYKKLSWG
jgi:hypothetical protein